MKTGNNSHLTALELNNKSHTAIVVAAAVLIDPLNLWSLWVPLSLLGLIVLAAVYFVHISNS